MNIYKFSFALCMLLIATSCSNEIDIDAPETGNVITVRSKVATKAGYSTQSLPSGFVMDIIQGETGYNYTNVMMSADPATGTYRALSSQGNILALKWASSNHSGAQIKAMTIPSGVATALDDNNVEINVATDQSNDANFNLNDILGASINDGNVTIKGDDIEIAFNHLMSKLHVVYETSDKDQNVEYIKLKNVCTKGYYSYAEMKGGQPTDTRGDITMFLNPSVKYGTMAAEAIFYPYTPTTSSSPQLVVKLSGGQEKTCNINIPNGFSFDEGKRYLMNIRIDRDGSITNNNQVSAEYDWVKNVPGGKILWIGTSIPAGSGVNNYPQMIANATGLEIINNSVGGSVVLKPSPAWKSSFTFESWNNLYAGGLSQTHAEAEEFRQLLTAAAAKVTQVGDIVVTDEIRASWVTEQMGIIYDLSYQSRIIPYVDGTKDNCTTVIIDHGFNDVTRLILEAGGLKGVTDYTDTDTSTEWGYNYLTALKNKEISIDQHISHLQPFWDQNLLVQEDSYILAMNKIVDHIKSVNPNIRIIIGNYFATDSPWVNATHYGNQFDDFKLTQVLLYYNEAVAGMWDLDIVNVYKDDAISDWLTTDFYGFCPDGVHPSADATGKSNRAIADVYLKEFSRIFGNSAKTKSSTNAYDWGWEDVKVL